MRYEVRILRGDSFETLMLEAASAADAHAQALARQLLPVQVRAQRSKVAKLRFDLSLFVQELIELLDAGLELIVAIELLASRERSVAGERELLVQLLTYLREGQNFSGALEQCDDVFPALFVGLIRAAEQTSGLQAALTRYLEYRNRFDGLRQKISAALIYPAILLGVGSLVALFLLGFVVPRFAAVYRGGARDLPFASRILLDWGDFFSAHAPLLSAVFPLLLGLAWFALRRLWNSGQFEAFLQSLPGIGAQVQTFRIAQIYLALGTLLNGGMPLLQALTLAQGVAAARVTVRLQAVGLALERGAPASVALASQELVTPVSLRLIQAGEGSGRLGEMLLRAARYHDHELARRIERASKLFEPLLMAAIGIVVGLIVVLLYLPIFDLAGSLQ